MCRVASLSLGHLQIETHLASLSLSTEHIHLLQATIIFNYLPHTADQTSYKVGTSLHTA